jgi:hypothetical protein
MSHWKINPDDIRILRGLYLRKRKISQDPLMEELRQLWKCHASLQSRRPMILAETCGVLDELVPLSSLQCREEWARKLERELRELIFRFEKVKDDYVVEPFIDFYWFITMGDFGMETRLVRGDNAGRLGSYHWDPPVKDLTRELECLHIRSLEVDREKSTAWQELLNEHFGDILPIRLRGSFWWTAGLTWDAINLLGLEAFMLSMHDHPNELHQLMVFLRDDFLYRLDWFEQENLLTLNNENDYIGSGSVGYTSELPQPGWQPGMPVKVKDLWGLSESQETVGVSPRMFEEFIFPYQKSIAERFGLLYYGCCEPVHNRVHLIRQLPNLRRISVSPWCDQQKMVDAFGKDIIYCRKPNPALISTANFDEITIHEDVRNTLKIFGDFPIELVMKDVHTLDNQTWRLGRWVKIARQVCEEL